MRERVLPPAQQKLSMIPRALEPADVRYRQLDRRAMRHYPVRGEKWFYWHRTTGALSGSTLAKGFMCLHKLSLVKGSKGTSMSYSSAVDERAKSNRTMSARNDVLRSVASILLLVLIALPVFAGEPIIHVESDRAAANRLSFGNLRRLNFDGRNGRYTLNGTELSKVLSDSIHLDVPDHDVPDHDAAERLYRVRVTFLKTVLLYGGEAVIRENQPLLQSWAGEIPLVSRILKSGDMFGSIKPILYELVEPRPRSDLQLQEELVLLWSTNPLDKNKIGYPDLVPSTPFLEPIADIQYRGHKGHVTQLTGKALLQILYVKDRGVPHTLGAFVIVSKMNGQYEFYRVPRTCLDQIMVAAP